MENVLLASRRSINSRTGYDSMDEITEKSLIDKVAMK